jgi:hypothetical protein
MFLASDRFNHSSSDSKALKPAHLHEHGTINVSTPAAKHGAPHRMRTRVGHMHLQHITPPNAMYTCQRSHVTNGSSAYAMKSLGNVLQLVC